MYSIHGSSGYCLFRCFFFRCFSSQRQWRWGCSVTKPTGLLALRLPNFFSSMYSRQLSDVHPPVQVAIGKDASGQFRTSKFKEYPGPFSAALAGTIIDELHRQRHRGNISSFVPPDPALLQWVREAEELCSPIREAATWLPDYQGR